MIYVVRHGQTDWNVVRRTQGQTNIPLNDVGREQAKALTPYLSTLPIDVIVSSDLARAAETADIINQTLQKPCSRDARLREINYGEWEGSLGYLRTQEDWGIFNYHPDRIGAEPLFHVFERVKSFCDAFKKQENVLVVTHGGFIRMMMYYMAHPDAFELADYLKTYPFIAVRNTDVFEWNPAERTVERRTEAF